MPKYASVTNTNLSIICGPAENEAPLCRFDVTDAPKQSLRPAAESDARKCKDMRRSIIREQSENAYRQLTRKYQ